jgi:tRNA(fMet)-specific endonuclease VapC
VGLKVLPDTNAYSAMMSGQKTIIALIRKAEKVLFSPIVAGELFYGFQKGARFEENRKKFMFFLKKPRVETIPITNGTAEIYGRFMKHLRSKGRPIPTNDIWIAAQAAEAEVVLLSYDGHFANLPNLSWVHLKR